MMPLVAIPRSKSDQNGAHGITACGFSGNLQRVHRLFRKTLCLAWSEE
jgi:hypothetical protein